MRGAKQGLLLLNLGTPDDPGPQAVGRYLREFLMDEYVIDIPYPLRWFLVNALIVPRRKYASSELYRTIWTERGSPLKNHLDDLAAKVRTRSSLEIATAMRYGNPSIAQGLNELKAKGIDDVIVFALYPQYAESTSLSSRKKCEAEALRLGIASLRFFPAFFNHLSFIGSYAAKVREHWGRHQPQHLLMSFHGLPERHVIRTDHSGGRHCLLKSDCCSEIGDANRDCYRAQSFATARALAIASALAPSEYTVSFQSRLGRAEWIKPYTEDTLSKLARNGVKRLAVACPAFTADCLETLEEIAVRGKEVFLENGGESYTMIPCLNSDDAWAESVTEMTNDFARIKSRT